MPETQADQADRIADDLATLWRQAAALYGAANRADAALLEVPHAPKKATEEMERALGLLGSAHHALNQVRCQMRVHADRLARGEPALAVAIAEREALRTAAD